MNVYLTEYNENEETENLLKKKTNKPKRKTLFCLQPIYIYYIIFNKGAR